jgi:hypothetical protein
MRKLPSWSGLVLALAHMINAHKMGLNPDAQIISAWKEPRHCYVLRVIAIRSHNLTRYVHRCMHMPCCSLFQYHALRLCTLMLVDSMCDAVRPMQHVRLVSCLDVISAPLIQSRDRSNNTVTINCTVHVRVPYLQCIVTIASTGSFVCTVYVRV